ncbi:hypothetical protein PGTUg99_031387 [Puccinia graminis f. sp. tritici]|uniref:Uncharacterized protein n=1 Tax=Puccinia graminis f. sp. tritici TaxID=56615 RepID=A0A5B0PIJ1_PUCGR|nr:hypothetical protein PGTUg99_031387 [Puccinia graminis f. sp. tritici]
MFNSQLNKLMTKLNQNSPSFACQSTSKSTPSHSTRNTTRQLIEKPCQARDPLNPLLDQFIIGDIQSGNHHPQSSPPPHDAVSGTLSKFERSKKIYSSSQAMDRSIQKLPRSIRRQKDQRAHPQTTVQATYRADQALVFGIYNLERHQSNGDSKSTSDRLPVDCIFRSVKRFLDQHPEHQIKANTPILLNCLRVQTVLSPSEIHRISTIWTSQYGLEPKLMGSRLGIRFLHVISAWFLRLLRSTQTHIFNLDRSAPEIVSFPKDLLGFPTFPDQIDRGCRAQRVSLYQRGRHYLSLSLAKKDEHALAGPTGSKPPTELQASCYQIRLGGYKDIAEKFDRPFPAFLNRQLIKILEDLGISGQVLGAQAEMVAMVEDLQGSMNRLSLVMEQAGLGSAVELPQILKQLGRLMDSDRPEECQA